MSGGFFRGTSADQDTRFSNKQAKLLKSQRFAPELENLVDITKVNMDIMRPWIAKRVTELIGFEDEVLINFIYGLLEGKAVNGKEVQISLTGFMERNTGKFMKELWALLLSAQQNVSSIPQQFLDAKEEETKKKKAETDRIANEIHRNKEKEKLEFEQAKAKMGGEDSLSRDKHTKLEVDVKWHARESSIPHADDKERIKRNGRRVHRSSRSPDSPYHSQSPRRKHLRSLSKSSNSRSSSNERERSRSKSGPPPSRSRSISSERHHHHGRELSMTPTRRRNMRRSPSPRHAPLHSKRRSTSHSRYRSPSPVRYRVRSPVRHRSRSPVRRRSRSPIRRRSRSPIRRRSRTPVHVRSLSHVRRRSRTPIRRSPVQHRSRTSLRRRSPSPIRCRSPSPVRHRSPSPVRRRSPSPVQQRSPSPVRRRSPFPVGRSPSLVKRKSPSFRGSPSPVNHSSSSPMHHRLVSPTRVSSPPLRRQHLPTRRRYQRSPSTPRKQSVSPPQGRPPLHGRRRSYSPVRRRSTPEESSSPSQDRRGSLSPIERGSMKNVRSPIQSPRGRARRRDNYSPARRAPSDERDELPMENRRGVKSVESKPVISLRSPQRDMLDQNDLHGENRDLSSSMQKSSIVSHVSRSRSYSDEQRSISPHANHEADALGTKSRKTQLPDRLPDKVPDRVDRKERKGETGLSVKGREIYNNDGARGKGEKITQADDSKGSRQFSQQETLPKSRNSEQNDQNGLRDSPLKEAKEGTVKVKEKRKRRKSDSQEIESDGYSSYDSYEERKEAKRRRKEKLKKEKRRQRREERRRRKEERRVEKLKLKSGDSDSSSSDHHTEDDRVRLRYSRARNIQETELDQKKLEIELREKALETLRAKKGLNN